MKALKDLNVVILHDWLTGFRGGERVLEVFTEIFPTAPIYTLFYVPGTISPKVEDRKIVSSFLNSVPGAASQYRKLLPLFPSAAKSLKITEQPDLVLSSSHAMIKAVPKPAGAKHLCYVHSPMRYIYDQFDVYFGPTAPLSYQIAGKAFRGYLTREDLKSNKNVDRFLANSNFVAERIQKFYQQPSTVVHPFVELADFKDVQKNPPAKKPFFAMVTAFAPNKRVDLAIQTFNKMGLNLKIIGGGQEESELRKMAGPTIEFLGQTDRATVIQTLAQAQALIFPGVEDFGIVPLEALACGTPIIALKVGGVLDTLDESVAEFFENASHKDLSEAILRFQNRASEFRRQTLISRAEKFSREIFKEKISNQVQLLFS